MTARLASKKPVVQRWHYYLPSILIYLLLVVVTTIILVWRFPNNVAHPNFYAEDGSVFLQNIINKGWLHAVFTPFNGYFVIGIYILCGLGWILNAILGGAGLLSLSGYFALASIIGMASVISLPCLLFRRTMGNKRVLLIILFCVLLPLPLSPHIVIGTIGNQKWIFMYLAFLLSLYRLYHAGKLHLGVTIAVDLGLLIAAYTNSTVYFLIPVLFIPYLLTLWRQRQKPGLVKGLLQLLRSREVISLLVLCVLLLPQVIYVILHGIPKLPGYLDSPFQYSRVVELFINRTYLFGATHLLNGHMNNALSVILFIVLLATGLLTRGKERIAFWLGIYAAGVASLLFTVNRPGVSAYFLGYQPSGSGPDQFFYAQTLIMYTPIVIAAFAVARRITWRWLGISLLSLFSLFVILSGLMSNTIYGARWRNASVFENSSNTFIDQALASCSQQNGQSIRVVLYPYATGQFSLTAARNQVCTPKLQTYQSSVQDLGLVPDNNDYSTVLRASDLQQTFVASENHLDGLRIFLSDFGNYERTGTYTLTIYNSQCNEALRTSKIPTILLDSSLYNARFAPIVTSKNKTYCFKLLPPTGNFSQVAVQQSAPNVYLAGQLKLHGVSSDRDVVFSPLYSQIK